MFEMESVVDLFKEMALKAPSQKNVDEMIALAKENFSIGEEVEIVGTSYIGKVTNFNTRTHGFYPGDRYPVFVKIIRILSPPSPNTAKIGDIFEYGIDQLTSMRMLEQTYNDYLNGIGPQSSSIQYLKCWKIWDTEKTN